MIVFLFLLARHSLSEEQKPTETEANIEEDKSLLETQVLSDFITARLSRNLTVKGQHELEPIVGKYLRKPLVNHCRNQPFKSQSQKIVFYKLR
ncbi:hypothetical protein TVAGG3_0059630 [Trichomonas vaginalis G3]|uniref:hypothetical protein n=1 Tax=Trichomonas vaginalis (strain ATCC PRA-98 / G3) TaxID=412133 RepID=UPI0021E5C10F|nr:hypothetical protein TVAGG3_0059630 [Trichomonas vaginalis G3]KAI5541902.1 hypothetical protein TVAGG3_0059630 [Trichomonas vaginalis G3]